MAEVPAPTEAAGEVVSLTRFAPMQGHGVDAAEPARLPIRATPYVWVEPAQIPVREWLYGRHYIRRFVSVTLAPGGVGKSSLVLLEAVAIATGRNLAGIEPVERARVWYWNGEDPKDELNRRIAGIMKLHGIAREELEGWLFVDTGRDMPIRLAEPGRNGPVRQTDQFEEIVETIRSNRIDVIIFDPFVSIHCVPENDNGAIDLVAKILNEIAERTNAAIMIVHHVRKTNGAETTVEDGRGASALLGAVRAARTMNPMSENEASGWGIENRRQFFRTFDGKANLAPPSDRSIWYFLEPVDLGNATASRPSDWVAVVGRWDPPGAFDDVTIGHLEEVRRRAAGGIYRADCQADNWIGIMIADVLDLNLRNPSHKAKVKRLLKVWVTNGALVKVKKKDLNRNDRMFIEPGAFEG